MPLPCFLAEFLYTLFFPVKKKKTMREQTIVQKECGGFKAFRIEIIVSSIFCPEDRSKNFLASHL
jgi:hypothetical protein